MLYVKEGKPRDAYRAFTKGIDPYAGDTTIDDLYTFGMAALRARRTGEAKSILTYLTKYKLGSRDVEWRKKVERALAVP